MGSLAEGYRHGRGDRKRRASLADGFHCARALGRCAPRTLDCRRWSCRGTGALPWGARTGDQPGALRARGDLAPDMRRCGRRVLSLCLRPGAAGGPERGRRDVGLFRRRRDGPGHGYRGRALGPSDSDAERPVRSAGRAAVRPSAGRKLGPDQSRVSEPAPSSLARDARGAGAGRTDRGDDRAGPLRLSAAAGAQAAGCGLDGLLAFRLARSRRCRRHHHGRVACAAGAADCQGRRDGLCGTRGCCAVGCRAHPCPRHDA